MSLEVAKPKRASIIDLSRMLVMPTLEPSRQRERIEAMERDLILPVKLLLVIYLFFNVFLSEWFWDPVTTRELIQNIIKWVFFTYAILNVIAARIFLSASTIPLGTLRARIRATGEAPQGRTRTGVRRQIRYFRFRRNRPVGGPRDAR